MRCWQNNEHCVAVDKICNKNEICNKITKYAEQQDIGENAFNVTFHYQHFQPVTVWRIFSIPWLLNLSSFNTHYPKTQVIVKWKSITDWCGPATTPKASQKVSTVRKWPHVAYKPHRWSTGCIQRSKSGRLLIHSNLLCTNLIHSIKFLHKKLQHLFKFK